MGMFSSRKGIVFEHLTGIILAVIAFVLIAGVAKSSIGRADAESADKICMSSAAVRGRAIISPLKLKDYHIGPLLCKNDQEIVIDGKDSSGKYKDTGEVINELMAKIANVWAIFGEGRYTKGVMDETFFGFKNSCFRYYIVEFKNLPEQIDALTLKTASSFFEVKKKKTNLASYIENCPIQNCFIHFLSGAQKDRKYAIVYADIENGQRVQQTGMIFSELNMPLPTLRNFFGWGPADYCEFQEGY